MRGAASVAVVVLAVAVVVGVAWRAETRLDALESALSVAVVVQEETAAAAWEDQARLVEELERLGATLEPGRCEWSMVPSRARQRIKDAVALTCPRQAPCWVSWGMGGG